VQSITAGEYMTCVGELWRKWV